MTLLVLQVFPNSMAISGYYILIYKFGLVDSSIALMLVLDCSSSMSRTSTYLSVAKQGAIKCVEAMTANDSVGVISFNRTAKVRSEIIPATDENKEILSRTISSLTTSQGTYYVEALELAHEELLKSTADKKHVIFLSDGNPSDRGYTEAVQAMADDGITVSTIGLGYSSNELSAMAETGSGRYYYVRTASDLPDIMLTETEQIVVSSYITGEFVPIIAKESDLTASVGNESLPLLTGYLGTTLKEDATAYLITEEEHPIFASWKYGAGTVAFFASDLYGNWSANWVNSSLGQTLTKAFVSTTVDEFHDDSSLAATVTLRGKTADITVESSGTEIGHSFTVDVAFQNDYNTYTLVQTGTNTYEGSIKVTDNGIYDLMITETDASGNIVDYAQTALAVSYSSEYDAFAGEGQSLLSALCSATGGILSATVQKLVNSEVDTISLLPLGIIVAILLLADIAVRKIRWKDIQNYFNKLQSK